MGGLAGKGVVRARLTMHPKPHLVERAFREAGVTFGDWRPALIRIAPILRDGMLRALDSKGASIGHKWPAGRQRYRTRKLREGFGSEPLVRTGWFGAAARAVIGSKRGVRITKKSVFVGLNGPLAERAGVLQFKRGFWFADFDESMRSGAAAEAQAYVDSVLAVVRAKLRDAA